MLENAYKIRDEQHYIIGDVGEVLPALDSKADVICLDDAWARPQRADWFGVEYDTHGFSRDADSDSDEITTTDVLDLCRDLLVDGGWLIADADDWLLPRLINYLRKEWGDVAASYNGGGYRRIGGVTFQTKAGEPDKSTPGMYLSNGGYPVVFAHKGETNRKTSVSARQVTRQASFDGDWGSVKPIEPYRAWIEGLMQKGEHLVIPCAGTAPSAIAAEQLFGDDIRYTCIDNEPKALEMFKQRRDEVISSEQDGLSSFD
jgi:hypothetical protein